MGFFDFFKSKKKPGNELLESLTNSLFPKGIKDIQAGTNELLYILNNKIDSSIAENIFVKSSAISRIAKDFDKERLKLHLSGYCIQYFNDSQIDKYYNYLKTLSIAMLIDNRTPSEVRRVGENYVW